MNTSLSNASAGSGKTYTLVQKSVDDLPAENPYQKTLFVIFWRSLLPIKQPTNEEKEFFLGSKNLPKNYAENDKLLGIQQNLKSKARKLR